jgi:hypothetical protein
MTETTEATKVGIDITVNPTGVDMNALTNTFKRIARDAGGTILGAGWRDQTPQQSRITITVNLPAEGGEAVDYLANVLVTVFRRACLDAGATVLGAGFRH